MPGVSDYNELKLAIAQRDLLRHLAAAALSDQMNDVVRMLVECNVLPPGTRAQRPSLVHGD